MPELPENLKRFDWRRATWEGSRREQLRRWAALPLERIIAAIEEIGEVGREVGAEKSPDQCHELSTPTMAVQSSTKASPPSTIRWLPEALGLSGGDTPFPWQEDLFRQFLSGTVARALDIPTGLGKTGVMAIWLVARAHGAALPRRLVYVVDRRAVVDQATEVAEGLRQCVDGDLQLKQALGLDGRSLPISTLRGQHVDNKEWLEDPTSPAIIVGTVDMIGSRLLFNGYGVSRKMRPYHAGLLGVDALVVLDEAHLVPSFEQLLRAIADDASLGPRVQALSALAPSSRALSLSATGRSMSADTIGLTPEDLRHCTVQKRLNAKKRLTRRFLDKGAKLEEELARCAWKLSDGGKNAIRCIIFCDERSVAERAKLEIEKLAKGDKKAGQPSVEIHRELFVGGRRVLERERAAETLRQLGFIAGSKVERKRPAFLFATSAGEVGVDLDADHMVCDLVEWERMVQRLGRVNRRGEPEEHAAHVDVLVEPEPKSVEDLFGKEPSKRTKKEAENVDRIERMRAVTTLLEQLPWTNGGRCDASPGALHLLKRRAEADPALTRLLDAATTPAPLRPALSRAVVDAWSATSLAKHTGRPAIGPWLRGWIKEDPQTAIAWRTHLPVRLGGATPSCREIQEFFEAAPPHTSELLETETFRVVTWLEARANDLRSRAPAATPEKSRAESRAPRGDDVVAFVLEPDGDLRSILRLQDLTMADDRKATKERREGLKKTLADATLIVNARLGGLTEDGLLYEKEAGSPHTLDGGNVWLGADVIRFRVRSVDAAEATTPVAPWRERLRFAADLSDEGETRRWLIVDKWRHDSTTEEDRSSSRPQLLGEHQSCAERRARSLVKALRLPDEYVEMLAAAARGHDEGKRARRWQRAFNAPDGDVYAKTRGPINQTLLDGYRHELGSYLVARQDKALHALASEHWDLALHLIAAHHGFARPVIGARACDDVPPSALQNHLQEIALRFARLQARWGPWGLAWWEALLRAADQQASRENDAEEAAPAGGSD